MKISTPLTAMLGIDLPIIGAPMFLVSYEELTIAVSEAGGLGMFALPNYRTVPDLEAALEHIRRRTDRPIGVNIHLSGRFEWQAQLEVCLDYGVTFFISSLGDPRHILEPVHARGGFVFADVISRRHALSAKEKGVDGLVAVAAGAGGHAGQTPTMVLVPYLKALTGLPVLAAGGVSTGQQLAAALTLGACGAVVGTRLVASREAGASEAYKQAVVDADPDDIVYTDQITGNPANWLAQSIDRFDGQPDLSSKKWLDLWSAGRSVAQADAILPAGRIVSEMAEECAATLLQMPKLIEP
ncbi:MAG: nitronate monooxygenase [Desulfatibacillum sp.]|nr:nitronate monooxygenase [Desulfatibacillum sp.]